MTRQPPTELPEARRLVLAELERLLLDHYADGRSPDCPGCRRAAHLDAELAVLRRVAAEARR